MNRHYGPKLEDHRTVGLLMALGAVFGGVAGAAIGVPWADAVHWMGVGIPVGISIGLAVGAVFSKPTRFEQPSSAAAISWAGAEDDRSPFMARTLNRRVVPLSESEASPAPQIAAPIPPFKPCVQRSSSPSAGVLVAVPCPELDDHPTPGHVSGADEVVHADHAWHGLPAS